MDYNHMAMDRLSGQQGLLWVNQSYHAMHHINPNNLLLLVRQCVRSAVRHGDADRRAAVPDHGGGRRLWRGDEGAAEGAGVASSKRPSTASTSRPAITMACGESSSAPTVPTLSHGAKSDGCWDANHRTFVDLIDLFIETGRQRLTPPEVWALGSEAEFHGDMGLPELKDYAGSKRAFAQQALGYYRSADGALSPYRALLFHLGDGAGPDVGGHGGRNRAVFHPARLPLRAGDAHDARLLELLPLRAAETGGQRARS